MRVGDSAVGLEACTRLLECLPADSGAAIAIVSHVRNMTTQLHEILPSFFSMPVELITEKFDIQPRSRLNPSDPA
ncbi:chemotaxis protein CheB [Pelagicoccus sp. SDUM812003]|uniref:chemotaxis protein CheB n=1 Tax=Pelagicoccus sp. SDUM812003 TaxID=3041267 RepID=UPI00280F6629|nr:chemotaxis protein CheB [Pelagicoccus sp. SDUM812003]MDQ8204727.1 chemotaxis protein CheB [Pelagicoccus sp. SDUM812003]